MRVLDVCLSNVLSIHPPSSFGAPGSHIKLSQATSVGATLPTVGTNWASTSDDR